MVISKKSADINIKSSLKGGQGKVKSVNYIYNNGIPNCRMIAQMIIDIDSSIGKHTHIGETEYYLLLEGEVLVDDNGKEQTLTIGDLVMTGPNEYHSIINIGEVPAKILAFIITH